MVTPSAANASPLPLKPASNPVISFPCQGHSNPSQLKLASQRLTSSALFFVLFVFLSQTIWGSTTALVALRSATHLCF
jgi:hypothetical protein